MKYQRPDLNIFTPKMMKKLNAERRKLVRGQGGGMRRKKRKKTKFSLT